ncbi:hypothetical protein [Candidatus Hamiltonella defensa]|uniref:hypothetical protein n=1 Tax=Candidatus Williamhamiltonella defendens TaxID=138072 RepID=UPI001583F635|nr:hypothetical protein [Candidatus Hamiltonella defensa]
MLPDHIRRRDMLELAVELANLIEKWKYSKEKCKSLLYYIAQAGNTIDGEGFIRTLAEKAPTYREDFMTIAEQLEAKGEARGIQQGKQEGYQLGRQDANKELAQQLLSDGIDRTNVKRYTGLSDRELDQL